MNQRLTLKEINLVTTSQYQTMRRYLDEARQKFGG